MVPPATARAPSAIALSARRLRMHLQRGAHGRLPDPLGRHRQAVDPFADRLRDRVYRPLPGRRHHALAAHSLDPFGPPSWAGLSTNAIGSARVGRRHELVIEQVGLDLATLAVESIPPRAPWPIPIRPPDLARARRVEDRASRSAAAARQSPTTPVSGSTLTWDCMRDQLRLEVTPVGSVPGNRFGCNSGLLAPGPSPCRGSPSRSPSALRSPPPSGASP
jgi:hypothetical protein